MSLRHPAEETLFSHFPRVMGYIEKAPNQISFAQIQQKLIRKNYELQAKDYDHLFEDDEIPQPPTRQGKGRHTNMYRRLSEILNELTCFGLVEVRNRRRNNSIIERLPTQSPRGDVTEDWMCCLTPEGYDLLKLVTPEKYLNFKVCYFNLMFNHFPIVSKLLLAVHNCGKDYVVLPRVTAQQLGLEDLDLEKPDDLIYYLNKVADSVIATYYTEVSNPEDYVKQEFRSNLPEWKEKILKTSHKYHERGRKYPRFLIIARIRDYCVTYFARKLTGDGTITGRRLEALSSRLSKMEIIGYSDYIYKGRLLFLCSWVTPLLKAPTDTQISSNYKQFLLDSSDAQTAHNYLILHQPEYLAIKSRFEESLTKIFEKLYFEQRKQFVSIPDLREYVCLDLNISTQTFDRLMIDAYNDSFDGKSNLEITLASDPRYVKYSLDRWHRAPLRIEGRPMTVARIKERMTV